eukprot:m.308394 g.308394  ORF g.308394 m.308394 type:complete len:403 (+) comp43918_c0_seq1:144-1352(+)
MSQRVKASLPDPEPEKPANGWRFPVSAPFIPPKAKQSVVDAIDAGLISSATTPVRNFENELKKLFGVPTAKACSSGYSGLFLCLKAAGISSGDEVIVPALTMIAVANAVMDVGATPVVIDVTPGKYNPTADQYRAQINDKTRAAIVCHTYGIPADLEPIRAVCDERRIVLIEDIAEAIGTTYKGQLVGKAGDMAAASLYANKLITSGDGGFVISKHACWPPAIWPLNGGGDHVVNLQENLHSLTNHGFVPEYHFMHLHQSGNYKMSGLEAAFVTPAVECVPEVAKKRVVIAGWYREFLDRIPGLKLMPKSEFGPDTPWVFGVEVESKQKRASLRAALAKSGIETRDYFLPLHLQPPMQSPGLEPLSLPNAEKLGQVGFYLPTYHSLEKSDVQFICESLRGAV